MDDNLANPYTYVDYVIATQSGWKLYAYPDSREEYRQLFIALGSSTRVKSFVIGGPSYVSFSSKSLANEDIILLARSLEVNNSLTHLCLSCFPTDAELGMVDLFYVLSRQKNITAFENISREFSDAEFEALMVFLRANTKLKQLSLYKSLNAAQMLAVIEALQENDHLEVLDLDGNETPAPVLLALARLISTRTKLYKLEVDCREWTREIEAEMYELLDKNYSLWDVVPVQIEKSPPVQRNYALYQKNRQAAHELSEKINIESLEKFQPVNRGEELMQSLTNDILKEICFKLSLKSLLKFQQASKQCYNFTVQDRGRFWRDYYFHHFSCIPGDVYILTDLTFGLKLINAKPSTEPLPNSFWQELLVNSCRLRYTSSNYFPPQDSGPMLAVLNRDFPQLIGAALSQCSFNSFEPNRSALKTKTAPYSNVWYIGYGHSIYHLGFERLHDGQMNGILFTTPDFSESWDNRFGYMRAIYEWMTARDEKEFSVKVKPLIQSFLAARDANTYNGAGLQIKTNLILESAIKGRARVMTLVKETIDQSAKSFCTKLGINHTNAWRFIELTEHVVSQFKQWTDFPRSELDTQRQQLSPKSNQNGEDPQVEQNYTVKQSKNRPIAFGPAALMKLYRVMLTWILMPVLRTFWPSDVDHDFIRYSITRQKEFPELYRQLYMANYYVPVECVTVGKSCPENWPIIAYGFAQQYLPLIIDAANCIVEALVTKNTNQNDMRIEALVRALESNPLLPKTHVTNLERLMTGAVKM